MMSCVYSEDVPSELRTCRSDWQLVITGKRCELPLAQLLSTAGLGWYVDGCQGRDGDGHSAAWARCASSWREDRDWQARVWLGINPLKPYLAHPAGPA